MVIATGLVKQYQGVTAVNNITFSVHEGEIFGGWPERRRENNDHRMHRGLTQPDAGSINVLG